MSGIAWMALRYFFPQHSEFGSLPHPWEPTLLHLHGWLAALSVFLLGWIGAEHVSQRWRESRRRASGLAMVGAAALLCLTGYGLYYFAAAWHELAAYAHELVGGVAILLAVTHWRGARTA